MSRVRDIADRLRQNMKDFQSKDRIGGSFAAPLGSAPTLMGHWRHSHGIIFCGTLRIARADFDTNPSPDFMDKVFDEICGALNGAQNEKGQR